MTDLQWCNSMLWLIYTVEQHLF